MKLSIEFLATEMFLPTKRHRNPRIRCVPAYVDVEIPEVTEEDFPVAMVTHTYQSVCEKAACYEDFERMDSDFRIFSEEYRAYHGQLFKPVRVTHGAAISLILKRGGYIAETLERCVPKHCSWESDEGEFTENSIIVSSSKEEDARTIRKAADRYLLFNGCAWEACGEPMYYIVTFGLGRNHGGTSMSVTRHYNENLSSRCYFNALHRTEAVEYGRSVAERRGDTESVPRIGHGAVIDVLMPEMVKRDPQKDHKL